MRPYYVYDIVIGRKEKLRFVYLQFLARYTFLKRPDKTKSKQKYFIKRTYTRANLM